MNPSHTLTFSDVARRKVVVGRRCPRLVVGGAVRGWCWEALAEVVGRLLLLRGDVVVVARWLPLRGLRSLGGSWFWAVVGFGRRLVLGGGWF